LSPILTRAYKIAVGNPASNTRTIKFARPAADLVKHRAAVGHITQFDRCVLWRVRVDEVVLINDHGAATLLLKMFPRESCYQRPVSVEELLVAFDAFFAGQIHTIMCGVVEPRPPAVESARLPPTRPEFLRSALYSQRVPIDHPARGLDPGNRDIDGGRHSLDAAGSVTPWLLHHRVEGNRIIIPHTLNTSGGREWVPSCADGVILKDRGGETCSTRPISGILYPPHMAFWIIKARPKWNENFSKFPIKGKDTRWYTDRIPKKNWREGDILFIWAGAPILRVIGLALLKVPDLGIDKAGEHHFGARDETNKFDGPRQAQLRTMKVMQGASFLKAGPSGVPYPLSDVQGKVLLNLVRKIVKVRVLPGETPPKKTDSPVFGTPAESSHGMKINRFFREILGATPKNPRWSWGAIDQDTDRIFLKVWEDQIDKNGKRVWVAKLNPSHNWPGWKERRKHIEAMETGAEGFGVVCRATDLHSKGSRKIKDFDKSPLLVLGKLSKEDGRIYARITKRIPTSNLQHDTLVSDIEAIKSTKGITATTKKRLIEARLGQGRFRKAVLSLWARKCAVTGSVTTEAIRASHIKPWTDSSPKERLDPRNGLPLAASLDALFDRGLISFDASGRMLVSHMLSTKERVIYGLVGKKLAKKPNAETAGYLSSHRKKWRYPK
jgi:hypothetical protein